MKDYQEAQKRLYVPIDESVRIIRELQELSQNELSSITVIPQSQQGLSPVLRHGSYTPFSLTVCLPPHRLAM